MTSVPRRGTLRTKVVAGVLVIVIAALAVFDFTAVTNTMEYWPGTGMAALTRVFPDPGSSSGRIGWVFWSAELSFASV